MSELPSQLHILRDFYYQALKLPAETSMAHAPGLIDKPAFFTLEHLQRHLNNPLLMPGWFSLIWQGKSVDCKPAVGRKIIRNSEVSFLNKGVVQDYLAHGASLVLEGIEFLERDINAMCGAIDAPYECVMSNAVVFFSQRGMEAYRGHFDMQDTLVIHLSGRKKWRIYERLAPRLINRGELTPQQMGKLQAEIVMNPGDALYLRSSTPHLVETTGAYSLHMSFDICDHTIGPQAALDLLLKEFNLDATGAYAPPERVLEKLAQHAQSPAYWQRVDDLQATSLERDKRDRTMSDGNRVTYFDQLIAADSAT